jgi:Glycosyl transferase family 90
MYNLRRRGERLLIASVLIVSNCIFSLLVMRFEKLLSTTTLNDDDNAASVIVINMKTATSSPNSSSSNSTTRRKYHSWGPQGSDLNLLLQRINYSYYGDCDECRAHVKNNNPLLAKLARQYQPFPGFIAMHHQRSGGNDNNNTNDDSNNVLPTLFLSKKLKRQVALGSGARFKTVLPHLQTALAVQLPQYHDQFPALVSALEQVGIVPLLFDYGDYRGCPDPNMHMQHMQQQQLHNYTTTTTSSDVLKRVVGVPELTISKSIECTYAFPMPTYNTYAVAAMGRPLAKNNNNMVPPYWVDKMAEWNHLYPWKEKIAKAYWRGGVKFSRHEFVRVANSNESHTSLFMDVKPSSNKRKKKTSPFEPPETSMKYKAVFDIDGNSWSERFPRLLCYNSAVILITLDHEDYEEYFMPDLQPHVHYIPASLHNFTRVAEWAMQPENDAYLQQVVQHANAFCRERMVEESINLDFLSVVNGYVETLSIGNPLWMEEWKRSHHAYVGPLVAKDGHGGFTNGLPRNLSIVVNHLLNPVVWNRTAAAAA